MLGSVVDEWYYRLTNSLGSSTPEAVVPLRSLLEPSIDRNPLSGILPCVGSDLPGGETKLPASRNVSRTLFLIACGF